MRDIRVRVPATSANLGPGFDAIGLALSLHVDVIATQSAKDRFIYGGDGELPDTGNNLIHDGVRAAFSHVGRTPPPLTLQVENQIPLARGLGSSSAALVAGLAIGDALLEGELGRDTVFQIAARLEGHPDNVAPAVYGGFTVAAKRSGKDEPYACAQLTWPEHWRVSVIIPDFHVKTTSAREVLPTTYSRQDAVTTAGRSALLVAAVSTENEDLLQIATKDVLHEPYRASLLPGFTTAQAAAREAGALAAFLSGAGPTLAIVTTDQNAQKNAENAASRYVQNGGRVLRLEAAAGYEVLE